MVLFFELSLSNLTVREGWGGEDHKVTYLTLRLLGGIWGKSAYSEA